MPDQPLIFPTERAMMPLLVTAAIKRLTRSDELWVLLEEQQLHSRIPDLVAVRIDLGALERRLQGAWARGLNTTELRALRAMRPDRGARLRRLAEHMAVAEPTARRVLARLVREGFAERTARGSYARCAPIRPVIDRAVTFEAKRADAVSALLQAREHSSFVDASYVAFDACYRSRFERLRPEYRHGGIGLLELGVDGTHRIVDRPSRSPFRNVLGFALSAERTLERLVTPAPSRRLPESRLPGARGVSDGPASPRFVGRPSRTAERLLAAAAP